MVTILQDVLQWLTYYRFCAACDVAIDKEWVNGLEKKWHPKCFTCIECTRVIDSKEKFYKVEKDG